MAEYVTVPTELDEGLAEKLFNDDMAKKFPHVRRLLWEGFCDNYIRLIAILQANPIIPDSAKAANYWRAKSIGRTPEFVPARINLVKGYRHCGMTFGPGAFKCNATINGVVFLETEGQLISVGGKHFEVMEWRKNEADKCTNS
jgi:hypothetical protein